MIGPLCRCNCVCRDSFIWRTWHVNDVWLVVKGNRTSIMYIFFEIMRYHAFQIMSRIMTFNPLISRYLRCPNVSDFSIHICLLLFFLFNPYSYCCMDISWSWSVIGTWHHSLNKFWHHSCFLVADYGCRAGVFNVLIQNHNKLRPTCADFEKRTSSKFLILTLAFLYFKKGTVKIFVLSKTITVEMFLFCQKRDSCACRLLAYKITNDSFTCRLSVHDQYTTNFKLN